MSLQLSLYPPTAVAGAVERDPDAAHDRHTYEAHHSLEVATRDNLDRVLAGQPPRYVVNPAVLAGVDEEVGRVMRFAMVGLRRCHCRA